ncbi:MAG: spermidine synthase [Gemmatimonadetes bacterium]|nr:spermidine synthase [Gemmatimonadota bacterium]NIO31880.1 spermidine synthase [Gemmatimonadota bacterium]
MRNMRLTLYAVFTLSGAAGLIYEMIWSRYLALFLGHSAYAQVLVIAIFLGGMALGALIAGARSERLHDPLKWYVGAELIAGVIGLFFHEIFGATTSVAYNSVFPALTGSGLLNLFKWTLAATLILPQSVLLGATFPLMAAGVLRRPGAQPGRVLAILYFTNSLGAAVGVLFAGFFLLGFVGLPGTLLSAAVINVVVAGITTAVASRYPAQEVLQVETGVEAVAADARASLLSADVLVRLMLAVAFGTAVASFAYEIGWLRMLALVLGSATHSFELMLSAFILGLALGAFWVRRRADRWRYPLRALGVVQLAMGICALATLGLYGASFYWTADLMSTFARSEGGYVGFTLARYAICLAIMFPASFCAGMTLPLITRTLLVAGAGERSIGGVYGVNTFGAIVGVAAAGFLLMPLIGLKGLIVGGATLDMALGAVILFIDRRRSPFALRLSYVGIAATVVAFAVGAFTKNFDHRLLNSGVYRYGTIAEPGTWEELFYKDGRTATVSVDRHAVTGDLTLRTNGKPDASLAASWLEPCNDSVLRVPLMTDAATQSLAPLFTLAHNPDARVAAVIGQGSGMSSHFLLGAPGLEKVITVEIEPQMINASRVLYPANRRVFDDPRSRIVIEDAKTYFASTPRRYDVIFSEPSNPWVSGIASLFAAEFYAHITGYLSEGGVFGQWLHLYEIDDGLVLSVLAAIHHSFGDYEIFLTQAADMLVVATVADQLPAPDWSVFRFPDIVADYCGSDLIRPSALESTRLTHRAALAPLLDYWEQPNSDFYPVLDLMAERVRFLERAAAGFLYLPIQPFEFTAPFFGRRAAPAMEGPPPVPALPRLRALAVASALNGNPGFEAADSARMPAAVGEARQRRAAWAALLEVDAEPADWTVWLRDLREVDRDLHAGTAGFAAEDFFRSALDFIDRHDGPEVVRDVVIFRHGLAGWRFEEAAAAAQRLLEAEAHRYAYITTDELHDGGTIALLRSGQLEEAERFYAALLRSRDRSVGDLRSRLLTAYVSTLTGTDRRSETE